MKGDFLEMKKRNIFIAVAVATSMVVPFSVFAANSDSAPAKNIRGFFRLDSSKLTDGQKADVKNYTEKMAQLQKDFINKMIENGSLTKKQGEAELKKVDEALANGTVSDLGMGRKGSAGHRGKGGFGMMGKIDISKLTESQKAELKTAYTNITTLQKEYINKLVSYNVLTKEQGEDATNKVNELSKKIESGNFVNGMMFGRDGIGLFGIHKIDTSKLTDAQKKDLESYTTKMEALRKELVDKMVSTGVISKEKTDDKMKKFVPKNKSDEDRKGGNGRQRGMSFNAKKDKFGKNKATTGSAVAPNT